MNPLVLLGLATKYRPIIALLALTVYHVANGSPAADIEADLSSAAAELFGLTPAQAAAVTPQA